MKVHKHTPDYLILLLVVLISLVFFIANISNPMRQYEIIISLSFLYIAWGIFHHARNHDLHLKVVVEYVVIAVIGILLLRGAIFH
ncbi:hypothetical protein A3D77_07030 [Candidatus Gottesmanbacteria bacterium RIFCSPHIGHO2_02_FULL_39_11]|uniref:Uncharacterized protein n=1 Tax=Candidatus Gottesmanbacteria bacterium RIFCSPHIGHO2_02_FULL_39_11 TaxID=1798382 RepID=A0A1F5ZK92_9BACT|nr:MAG: hypothetical protein A3D77_07030 [Candidatus Gottesmanbacteria bacterium RIFCSPHIGHO2_02_FULL_39_11]